MISKQSLINLSHFPFLFPPVTNAAFQTLESLKLRYYQTPIALKFSPSFPLTLIPSDHCLAGFQQRFSVWDSDELHPIEIPNDWEREQERARIFKWNVIHRITTKSKIDKHLNLISIKMKCLNKCQLKTNSFFAINHLGTEIDPFLEPSSMDWRLCNLLIIEQVGSCQSLGGRRWWCGIRRPEFNEPERYSHIIANHCLAAI